MSVYLHSIVREILRESRKHRSPGAHADLEGKDACGESRATAKDHGHVRSFLPSPFFLNTTEGKWACFWLISGPGEPGRQRLDY